MQEYEIAVQTNTRLRTLLVKPVTSDKNIEFQIWESGEHLFCLWCFTDLVGDTLRLTDKYSSLVIDPKIVKAEADIIQSEVE